MLLNLNNCSVLKPQGYSSLQSISETECYELKNILTFVFCWVEKLVLFFWTSPGYRVCWKGQGFGLVNQRWAAPYLWLKSLLFQFHQTKAMAPKHIPTSHMCKCRIISLLSNMCLTRGCVCFPGVVFPLSWRGELGPASRNQDHLCHWSGHVLVQLEPSAGKDGTARHESGDGYGKNPERTISILPNTPVIK